MIKLTGLQLAQDAMRKELEKLQTKKVALVGIHESADVDEESGQTVAFIGAANHFGTDKIPARPWLDVGVESGTDEYLDVIQDGIAEGESAEKVLDQLGVLAVGYTQQYITDLDSPPNAPSTIKRKGSANPLIDTGNMRQSVTYTIADQMPEEGL